MRVVAKSNRLQVQQVDMERVKSLCLTMASPGQEYPDFISSLNLFFEVYGFHLGSTFKPSLKITISIYTPVTFQAPKLTLPVPPIGKKVLYV